MLKTIHCTEDLISQLAEHDNIGFVPTMGNLHAGHISLIKAALKDHTTVVVSIYVNPTQFGANEDFTTYPRTLSDDIDKIQDLDLKEKKVFIFAPANDEEIYPHGKQVISAQSFKASNILEGALRPGHFDGMVTVVKRLFEIVHPSKAYFGKKDYQQLCLVKEMVKKFNLSTKIIGLETIRSEEGLALSSRNGYLSSEQRTQALILRNTLTALKEIYRNNNSISDVQTAIKKILEQDNNFNYLALTDADDLSTPHEQTKNLVLLGNYQIAETKLLDNLEI